jgi:hypothetical protein
MNYLPTLKIQRDYVIIPRNIYPTQIIRQRRLQGVIFYSQEVLMMRPRKMQQWICLMLSVGLIPVVLSCRPVNTTTASVENSPNAPESALEQEPQNKSNPSRASPRIGISEVAQI